MKIDWFMVSVMFFFIVFVVFLLIIFPIYGIGLEDYTTDKIVDCNDADGDLIEGLVCYDILECSNKMKFMNEKGCKEFVGGRR